MRKALVFTLVSGAVGLATVFACGVDDLNLEGRACPCGPGYICDTPRNVCVKPEVLLDGAIIVGEAAVNPPTPPPDDSGAPPCKGDECNCQSDTDCVDPNNPKCVGGRCAQCVTTPADNCPVGSYCVASTNECAPGCKADTECMAISPLSPRCNTTRHQCVECAGNGDCTGGKSCSPSGQCATGCFNDGGACDGGTFGGTCCSGLCIDVTKDPLNCNGCGIACGAGQTQCCSGSCSNPLTDKNNCGSCGAPCNSTVNNTGSSCSSGRCSFTCTSGWGHCSYGSGNNNTGCPTNLTTSTSHCGSCNTDCGDQVRHASGIFCASSSCNYTACYSGYSELDGKLYDGCEAPCGAIGQLCCNNTSCPVSGTCEPAPANDGYCH